MLDAQPYVAGSRFSVADAYLYTVLRWAAFFDIALARWPALAGYMSRVGERASVQAALAAE